MLSREWPLTVEVWDDLVHLKCNVCCASELLMGYPPGKRQLQRVEKVLQEFRELHELKHGGTA